MLPEGVSAKKVLTLTLHFDCGKIPTARGSRQVVRHQPSKLISAGSNPVSRSGSVTSNQYPVSGSLITGHYITELGL